MDFEKLTLDQRAEIIHKRMNTNLLVLKTTVGVNKFPPSIVYSTIESIIEIFLRSREGLQDTWMRFFVTIYYYGGKVVFKEFDDTRFEAQIIFINKFS